MPFLDLEEGIAEIFSQTGAEWFPASHVIRRKGRGDIESVRITKRRARTREAMRRRRRRIRLERALKFLGQVLREVEQQCVTLSSIKPLKRRP